MSTNASQATAPRAGTDADTEYSCACCGSGYLAAEGYNATFCSTHCKYWATTCTYCESIYDERDGFTHEYCSKTCESRDTARDLRMGLYYDHRYCCNCYRKIREVYPPARLASSSEVIYKGDPDEDPAAFIRTDVPDCAIGHAYPTPHTADGLAESMAPLDPTNDEWSHEPTDHVHERAICECGVTHHQTIQWGMSKRNAIERAKRLSDALDARLAEEKHEYHHDRDTLLDEVRARKSDPDHQRADEQIFEYALAEAICASTPYY